MKFLSMYKTVECDAPPTQAEMEQMGKLMEGWFKLGRLAAEGCMPTKLGARVRQSKGHTAVTDGPFGEAKEVLCGLAILQANSREEAIEHVKEFLRVAGDGECERRQHYEMPDNACAKKAEMRHGK